MKILIDMNLSPDWVNVLRKAGHESIHWSAVGKPDAPDRTICEYARDHGHILFTHDLDFGAILAATDADAPSVFQVRAQDVDPSSLGATVISVLAQCEAHLEKGALISLDESGHRLRVLPIHP